MIANSFKCFSDRNIRPPGKKAEIREKLLLNHYRKSVQNSQVAGHVGRVKTVVTNHLRKMFRSRMHKAAVRNTAARKNMDKLTESNSYCFHNHLLLAQATIR